jgi:hypothetical protein
LEEKVLHPGATRPPHRGLRRGLIVALMVVALTGALLPQAAQAHHRTDIAPIDWTGHRGWYIVGYGVDTVFLQGRAHVFVVGYDDQIWYAWERWHNGPFSTWHTIGGIARGDPRVQPQYVTSIHVRVLGLNNRYYCKVYNVGSGWSPWNGPC